MNQVQESSDFYDGQTKENQLIMDCVSSSLMLRGIGMADSCVMAVKAMKRKLSRLSEAKK